MAVQNFDDGIILVVGMDTRSKSRVADALADAVGAWEEKAVCSGPRKFRRKSEIAVVDTLAFRPKYIGEEVFQEVKRWIAGNDLRRMLRKRVCVVCVISGADALIPEEHKNEETNFFLRVYSWLHFLGDFIFPEHKQSVIFVAVNGDDQFDEDVAFAEKGGMKKFIDRHKFSTNNITYADLRDRDSFNHVVNSAIRNIFRLERRERVEDSTELTLEGEVWSTSELTPELTFQFRDVPMIGSNNVTKLGPWVPERVILFGRTGSGKSTLAQMLTLGRLDPNAEEFKWSSGIRGQTTKIHHGEGRGWYVVDTPGFGEQQDGSITSEEGERKIMRYVQMIGGIYTHYIYVVKKGRIDKLESILWSFFVELFGEQIKDHFTVVVMAADDKNWLAENIDDLRKFFPGCESFLAADFPTVQETDEELEMEMKMALEMECQETREESLKEVESGLASLHRSDTWCHFGEWSKMTERDAVAEGVFEIKAMTGGIQRAVNLVRIGAYRLSSGLHRLSFLLSQDHYCLMPKLGTLGD